jgi:RNA polymerase sigma factor (sigma-70 family)
MVSVLCYQFGIEHIEIAEDIVSDTFLAATESWALSGNPENPTAWLYTVAKNKTRNHFKRSNLFESKLAPEIRHNTREAVDMELDFSVKNMIFAICNPLISNESQIALALNVLCGFGVEEIANAFLTNREVIYKRLKRAKERLKEKHLIIEQPTFSEMLTRLDNVLTTIYLLFSEGYYSSSQNHILRKDLCLEAMRLNYFLVENENTNTPTVNALLALMCFHSSRFEARRTLNGEMILYPDQDDNLWDQELIQQGLHFLNQSSRGKQLSKYHLEAGIAYWHTFKQDTTEKWERILQLYNQLIILDDSPVAALNRTYALYKAHGKREAIIEAEKLQLTNDHLYYSLLGTYTRKLTLTWR